MKKHVALICVAAGVIACLLLISSCTTEEGSNDNGMLLGVWLSNDADERWTFNSDDTFLCETFTGTWDPFMSGTFSYSDTTHKLTLNSGGTIIMDLLLNAGGDRMAQGVDALRGGDTATLLGTWVGENRLPSATHTRTWTFTAGTISLHQVVSGITDDTANGTVTIDTVGKTFTVSGSDDTLTLSNGIYDYMVIGDGVTISDDAGQPVEYFDKL
jgi:hypothetical protein